MASLYDGCSYLEAAPPPSSPFPQSRHFRTDSQSSSSSCSSSLGSGQTSSVDRSNSPLSEVLAHYQGKVSSPAVRVMVVPHQRRQRIHNFGASDAWATQFVGCWPLPKRHAIADLLFSTAMDAAGKPKGIGLSGWRFNVGAGSAEQGSKSGIADEWRRAECFLQQDGTYDWGRQAGSLWFLKAANNYGVKHISAFVNSPPTSLTKNGRAFASGPEEGNLTSGRFYDFAVFLARVVWHIQYELGIRLSAISPVNEPQWQWQEVNGQEGCHYPNHDIRGLVLELDQQLQRARLNIKVEIPEAARLDFLLDTSSENKGLGCQLKEFFTRAPSSVLPLPTVAHRVVAHSYGTTFPPEKLISTRWELRRQMAELNPSLEYWMSEYCLFENNVEVVGEGRALDAMAPALYVARVIHYDIVVGGASSWQWWLAISPYNYKDGLVYVDKTKRDGQFYPSKLLWVLGNFSRFVRPGAQLVAISGIDVCDARLASNLMVSAYIHDCDRQVVVVVVNYSWLPQSILVQVEGASVFSYATYITDAHHNLEPCGQLRADQPFPVVPRSVMTFVGHL
eukprot:GGOE01007105.1.p1 GENE.GGOE01007105.1~~GGOE01007105.1.p1  ORF type:complete len:571 (-),score=104.41 GGOE01007105.1:1380-3068(-)